jgi:predicted nuclease of predicted toxin-antitoxin system
VPPQVLLDEHLSPSIAHALTASGFYVTCARDMGLIGMDDWDLIDWCAQRGFALCTVNEKDFEREHQRYTAQGRSHYGILIVGEWPMNELRAALESLLESTEQTALVNRLLSLPRP